MKRTLLEIEKNADNLDQSEKSIQDEKRIRLTGQFSNLFNISSEQFTIHKLQKLDREFQQFLHSFRTSDYFFTSKLQLENLIKYIESEDEKSLMNQINEIKKTTFLEYLKSDNDESDSDNESNSDDEDSLEDNKQKELERDIDNAVPRCIEKLQKELASYRQKRADFLTKLKPEDVDIDLLAFDVDYTLVTGSLHNACELQLHLLVESDPTLKEVFYEQEEIINGNSKVVVIKISKECDEEYYWDQLYKAISSKIKPSGGNEGQKEWSDIFKELIENKKKIALVSFTKYKPIVERFLKDKEHGLGLDSELIQQFIIVTGLPADGEEIGKTHHIQEARTLAKLPQRKNMSTTYLFEDSERNYKCHIWDEGMALHLDTLHIDKNSTLVRNELEEKMLLAKKIKPSYNFT